MSHKAKRNGKNVKGSYPSLADIVRKETDGGRLVVRFLMSAMQGDLQDAKPCHRLDAARQLLKLGADDAQLYVAAHGLGNNASNRRNGNHANHASNGRNGPRMPLNQELADFIRLQTKGGEAAVRFLVDVMQGKLESFKPHHRLSAAKELLRLCQDDKADSHDDRGEHEDDVWRGRTYMPIERQPKTRRRRRNGTARKHDNRGDGADKTAAPEGDPEQAEAPEHAPAQPDGEAADPTADREAVPDASRQRNGAQQDDAETSWYASKTPPPVVTMEEYRAIRAAQRQEEDPPTPVDTEPSYYERRAMSKGHDIWRDPPVYWASDDVNQRPYRPYTRPIDSTNFPRGP